MTNIEFVKKCIPFADGFELNEDQLIFPEGGVETLDERLLNFKVWEAVWEPLLLQRAIEGLNKKWEAENNGKWINIQSDCVEISEDYLSESINMFYRDISSIDKIKRRALKYVFERMDK